MTDVGEPAQITRIKKKKKGKRIAAIQFREGYPCKRSSRFLHTRVHIMCISARANCSKREIVCTAARTREPSANGPYKSFSSVCIICFRENLNCKPPGGANSWNTRRRANEARGGFPALSLTLWLARALRCVAVAAADGRKFTR